MEDAYEIGIRLVLENGVSSGIAALRDDLAAYDRALMVTTGRLRTLSEANGRSGIGRGLAAPVGAGVASSAVRGRAKETVTAPLDTETGRLREVTVPAAPPAAFKPPPVVVIAAPTMPRVPLVGHADGPPAGTSRAPAAPVQPNSTVVKAHQNAASSWVVPAPVVVPVIALSPPSYARYAPVSPVVRPPALATPKTPETTESRAVSLPAPDRREVKRAVASEREVLPPHAGGAMPSNAPAAPLGTQGATGLTSAPAVLATPAAAVAAAGSNGSPQGDVFLDGARIGRWMSDRLARDIDRPQSSVTGFDPRLSSAWPGSLHGM